MKNNLIEIAYTSRAPKLFNATELLDLLKKARRYNQRHDITGMLLYKNGSFLQVLEGESDVVEALFAKIKLDFRHYDVLKLYQNPLEQRNFSDWAMAFHDESILNTDGQSESLPVGDGYVPLLESQESVENWIKPSVAKVLVEAFKVHA
ncbi:BLUF domain-containing protein [Thiomicrorhabdus aquaedulcis]|uniref:BLUF domain-containing protein n=1 Tax=Thiomicrorhabdus aquaedulcis TaxID=2211106 RepID=UPI000FD9213F|nr:BLUF domain-containing protein [Thiomicrorhabdus aquaedulcis]